MSDVHQDASRPTAKITIRRTLAASAVLALLAGVVPPGCALEPGLAESEPAAEEHVETAQQAIDAPQNLALGMPATQSSDYPHPYGPVAGRAVDGNTDGNFGSWSVTHTNYDAGAWWQVDLQRVQSINNVVVWNRTDCCSGRLSNFNLLVSDDGVAWQAYPYAGAAGPQTSFAVNRTGRFVKVQLNGTDYLSLAEVQVFGTPAPVMGNARCGDTVMLKSWKGDYLHRPDTPQGVTTWSQGQWTIECNSNGTIQLRSWKGDYLHRPDTPQGVTTWNTGIGDEWTVVPTSGVKFMLRSWKGDYLHRPDSPQGVTTWSQGEWMAELVCPPGQVSIHGSACIVPTRAQLAQRYAPKVWLAAGEQFLPAAVEDFLPNVHEEEIGSQHYYVTNQPLGCDDCTNPPFLVGKSPAASTVPMYAEIVERTQNGQPTNVTDIVYWMFYPYNRGKSVCIGPYFDNYCPEYCPWPLDSECCVPRVSGCSTGTYQTFGNHVGDWEHVTIRFVDGQPSQVALSEHSAGQVFDYSDSTLQRSEDRIVVYAALGSHGLYPDVNRHGYASLPTGQTLYDDTGPGTLWDAESALVTFSPQAGSLTGSLSWLNYTGYWGNPESGCSVEGIPVGHCTLEGGPSSLLPRSVSQPALVTIE